MIAVTFLLFCAVPCALGNPTKPLPSQSSQVEESVIEFIDANRDAALYLTKEMSKISKDVLTTIKNILDNLIIFTSPGIIDDSFHELFDAGKKKVSDIPIIGPAVELGSKAVAAEAKLLSKVGKNILDTAKTITELDLNVVHDVGETYREAFEEASDKAAKIVKQFASDEVGAVDEGFHRTVDAFDEGYHRIVDAFDESYHRTGDVFDVGHQRTVHGFDQGHPRTVHGFDEGHPRTVDAYDAGYHRPADSFESGYDVLP